MQDTGRNSNKDSNMDNDMNNNANNNVNEQTLSEDKKLREMYDKLVGYEKTIHEQNQKRIKTGLRCIYIIPLFFLVLLMIVPDSSKIMRPSWRGLILACRMLNVRSNNLARLYIMGCPDVSGEKCRLTMRLYSCVVMLFLVVICCLVKMLGRVWLQEIGDVF